MRFHEQDEPLVDAFLSREGQEYRLSGDKLLKFISNKKWALWQAMKNYEAADFIILESLTNMGLRQRELRLTATPFKGGINIGFNFGNSPNNGVGNYYLTKNYKPV